MLSYRELRKKNINKHLVACSRCITIIFSFRSRPKQPSFYIQTLSKRNENIGKAENDLRPFSVTKSILHFFYHTHVKIAQVRPLSNKSDQHSN